MVGVLLKIIISFLQKRKTLQCLIAVCYVISSSICVVHELSIILNTIEEEVDSIVNPTIDANHKNNIHML